MESEQTSESLWDRWMRLTKTTIRTDFSPSHQALFPAGGRQDHFCSSMCKWVAGLAQRANRVPRLTLTESKPRRRKARGTTVLSSVWGSGTTVLIKRRGVEVRPITQDLSHKYKDRETLVISQLLAEEEMTGNYKAKVLRERVYWKEIITRPQMSSHLHNFDKKGLGFSSGNNSRPPYMGQLAI